MASPIIVELGRQVAIANSRADLLERRLIIAEQFLNWLRESQASSMYREAAANALKEMEAENHGN